MSEPLVSIVMTAYNGEKYIGEAIEGVLGQTWSNLELLIINDASTDNTLDVVNRYDDPRIRVVDNEINQGISNSRNIGQRESRGDFIAPHDQDDISFPDRLEKEIAVFLDDPSVVLVGGRVLDWRGNREVPWPEQPIPVNDALAWRLFSKSMFTHSLCCMRRQTLLDHQLSYRQVYHYAEDYELYHRLSEVGRIVLLEDILGKYRFHDTNMSLLKGEEMERNGRVFLLDCYNAYFEADEQISPEEMERIWHLLIRNAPAENAKDLKQVGDILERHLAKFIERRGVSGDHLEELKDTASRVWWKVIKKTALFHGPSILAQHRQFPTLGACSPGFAEKSTATLQALIYSLFKKTS